MKKINGNYTTQPQSNFPLDCETLQYIQDNRQMVEILGNIAGDKVILHGCTLNSGGTARSEGYVFVKTREFPEGEVLFFVGGDITGGMYLKKENISVDANAEPYTAAYSQRTLNPGIGGENYNWSDFVELSDKTNRSLMAEVESLKQQIAGLVPAPVGSIQMWPSDTLPNGYHLCDGSSLNKNEYPSLYAVLGTTYGGSGNSFNLPDMQGLFVAGKGANGYDALNAKGGANKVALAYSEMPKHNHNSSTSTTDGDVITGTNGGHSHTLSENANYSGGSKEGHGIASSTGHAEILRQNQTTSQSGSHYHTVSLKARGGDVNGNTVAHENRPPFIVLNYIIKVK